jgi:hypothetical protein
MQIFGEKSDKTSLGWNIPYERQQLISSLMTLGAFLGSCSAGMIPMTKSDMRIDKI